MTLICVSRFTSFLLMCKKLHFSMIYTLFLGDTHRHTHRQSLAVEFQGATEVKNEEDCFVTIGSKDKSIPSFLAVVGGIFVKFEVFCGFGASNMERGFISRFSFLIC